MKSPSWLVTRMVYGFGLCWVNRINKVSIQSLHPEFISAHSLLICLPFTATWVEHSGEHSFTHSEAAAEAKENDRKCMPNLRSKNGRLGLLKLELGIFIEGKPEMSCSRSRSVPSGSCGIHKSRKALCARLLQPKQGGPGFHELRCLIRAAQS